MKRILILTSLGNILEFYDFLLFGLLTPFFAPVFFPAQEQWLSLVQAYATFATGFLTRPFGGWFFGIIGDKFGRKTALTFSMMGMALATLCIGLLQDYKTFPFAPIFLLLLRLMQGISAGGEYHGAGITVFESMESRKFLGTAIISAAATIGGCLASIVSLVFFLLPLPEWSWRLPFVFGGIIGIIGWYARLYLPQQKMTNTQTTNIFQFSILWKNHLKSSICSIAVAAMSVAPFYTVTIFAPTHILAKGLITKPLMLCANIIIFIFLGVLGVLTESLSKRYQIWQIMLTGCVFVATLAIPFFSLLSSNNIFVILSAQIIFGGISQLYAAFGLGWVLQLFPRQTRYRGSAFCYNLGVAIFCGTIPMISESLIHYTHSIIAPAFYIITICILGFIAVFFSRNINHESNHES